MAKLNLEDIKKDMIVVADHNQVNPANLSKSLYFGGTGKYKEWEFRQLGGYNSVRTELFGSPEKPFGTNQTDLAILRGTQERRAEVTRLQRQLGTHKLQVERFRVVLEDAIKTFPPLINKTRKKIAKKNAKHERTNIAMISDTHLGLNIDPFEVEGNQYNWTVAARRLGKVFHDIAHFKLDHREDCEKLVLNMGGDLCQGIIHLSDAGQDLMTYQMIGAARMIVQAIDYELDFYDSIDICITDDNHMRLVTQVKGKDRAMAQKFDSFNTMLFESVQQAFRNEPRVRFLRPKTPFTEYKVFGRTHFLTHGDTVLNLGMPAKNINPSSLSAQISAMNAVRSDSERIEVVWAGHVHTGTYIALQNDVDVFINPSLSGIDPFAQSIGIISGHQGRTSRVGQWLVETTREERVGDQRIMWAHKADENPEYEKIVTPFDYELALSKSLV